MTEPVLAVALLALSTNFYEVAFVVAFIIAFVLAAVLDD